MPSFQNGPVEISYEDRGEGPPVLLIQGVGVAGCGWSPQVERLRGRFRCISFDHRGIGGSSALPGPAGPLSLDHLVDDTLALLDHLGLPSAHLVGHSMGGLVAQDVAHRARARVQSLGLLCTFTRGTEAARLSLRIAWLGMRTRLGTRSMRRRAFLELILAPGERTGDLDALCAQFGAVFGRDLAEQPPIVFQQLRALSRHDRAAELHALSGIRTLVVSGEHDPLALPVYGQQMAQAISGSRFVQMQGASHGLPLTRPDALDQLLAEHLLGR